MSDEKTLVEVIRRGRGLKRNQLAKKAGVSYQTLKKIERYRYKDCKDITKQKIADALNVPVELLF